MTALPPIVSSEGRYNTTDTCRILGISRRTLERYVIANKIKKRYRRTNSRPFYSGREIMSLWKSEY